MQRSCSETYHYIEFKDDKVIWKTGANRDYDNDISERLPGVSKPLYKWEITSGSWDLRFGRKSNCVILIVCSFFHDFL